MFIAKGKYLKGEIKVLETQNNCMFATTKLFHI